MEKVNRIGGLFFPAKDPDGLAEWSFTHLGISLVTMDDDELPWWQETGPSGIAPFPETTEYLGDPTKTWMVNFRVSRLDAMVQQPRAAGISVEVDRQPPRRAGAQQKNLAWLFHRAKGIVDRRLVQYRRRCGGSKSCAKHRQQKRVATCQFRCEDNAR